MIVGLACGLVAGAGALAVALGAAAPNARLAGAIARLGEGRAPTGAIASMRADRWGRTALTVAGRGLASSPRTAADLLVVDRSEERHAFDKLLLAVALPGFVLVTWGALGTFATGLPLPLLSAAIAVAAVAGFALPDLMLRREADARRREFGHALSAYLDLVSVVVAGGGGIETALEDAAGCGDHWTFDTLRSALHAARLTGRTPWQAFDEIGARLDLVELRELSAAVSLAGEQGARIRESLAARAESLRAHRLAAVEAEAQSATEKMSLPVVLMLFGFVAFVMYPALQFVLEGL